MTLKFDCRIAGCGFFGEATVTDDLLKRVTESGIWSGDPLANAEFVNAMIQLRGHATQKHPDRPEARIVFQPYPHIIDPAATFDCGDEADTIMLEIVDSDPGATYSTEYVNIIQRGLQRAYAAALIDASEYPGVPSYDSDLMKQRAAELVK